MLVSLEVTMITVNPKLCFAVNAKMRVTSHVPNSFLNNYHNESLSGSNMPKICSQSSQPPVTDLFVDLRDGNRLLSLLELLTGKQYVSFLILVIALFVFCTG
jgi:hypothetical protein